MGGEGTQTRPPPSQTTEHTEHTEHIGYWQHFHIGNIHHVLEA